MSNKKEFWEILKQEPVLEHPFLTVSMEQVRLPDGQIISDWPKVYSGDFVNAVVLNHAGEAMIIEGYKHGFGDSSWQMMGGYLEEGEDPMTAVQRELLEETGYATKDWLYLGSYVIDANRHVGVGHFFCARGVSQVAEPNRDDIEAMTIRWVPPSELRYALLDGRIAVVSYAINVALALLLL